MHHYKAPNDQDHLEGTLPQYNAGYNPPMAQVPQPYPNHNDPQHHPMAYPNQPGVMHGQPGAMYVQPGVMHGQPIVMIPMVPLVKTTGMEKLHHLEGVFIQQKLEILEAMSGFETPNTYYVFAMNSEGEKKGPRLFKAKEKSSCCARQCLSGDCRPFKMKIQNLHDEHSDDLFLELDRPCKCTCFCLERPIITVKHKEGGHETDVGTIVAPFVCCDLKVSIYDKNKSLRYSIVGSCCQLGIFCKCPCDSCQIINFDVVSPTGEKLCRVIKKSPGCAQAMLTDASNFSVEFPKGATVEDKALLVCATIFLDYRYFEQRPNNNRRQNTVLY